MTETKKREIIIKVEKVRNDLLTALIDMENLSIRLGNELEKEYPRLSEQLKTLGISTVDNAVDDICNGIGFMLEENGFPIVGQM